MSRISGFSSVEMLTVLVILGSLVGTGINIFGTLQTRSLRARAAAELAVIRQGLERFRAAHGDFPQTGERPSLASGAGIDPQAAEVKLFNALIGRLDARLNSVTTKAMLDWRALSTASPGLDVEGAESGEVANAFLDPWGNPYVYRYRGTSNGVWMAPTCLIYSLGPDGLELAPEHGAFERTAALNQDNIHG
ncbi:MAG: hypothetical protein HS122_10990 [Opitutaceae bacterium]|nr:hypothetical protein [Opitutaceae bacterium]